MTEVSFAKSFLTTLDNKPTKYQQDHIFDPATFGVRVPFTLPKLPHPQHPLPPKPNDDLTATPAPAPGAEPATSTTDTINITLKSSRNPAMTLDLPSTAPSTTISSLKQQVHAHLGGPSVVASIDKIKLLLNKKPVPSSKQTVADIVDANTKDLELGIMVMGGAPDPPPQNTAATAIKAREPEAAGPGSENAAVEAQTGVNPAEDARAETGVAGSMPPTKSRTESESQPVQPGEDSGDAVLQSDEFWKDLEGFLAQRIRSQDDAIRLRGVFESAWTSSSAVP
ncbi:hypothetical protein LTR70_008485 [Exophiala xenobiotica]|uniref:Ubiquitin-like domain-containing protein n=1 Tax=Lithohypha guttulata TaxID=1690604 RepID=A0ABR0K476_9EURO|nr:hypothetical protein LTR24_007013 [Lithohypha guttulata]KAK5311916.1 hypothetical protein LTR70_008485 [Exophiala xenobiotica]